ncbi:MAG: bifunctional phosphopantothenoylcysteine decarboxylase/phosphopantothenate--cysteine ligase CoaBC [Desulfocapsaceae bacterium]|nr:bifunctional phosphopantothenoylcysteine decarboxylase/phosphopantothenate--cysteine ligase CoaBC [Desulfocapsaceae bacterium]
MHTSFAGKKIVLGVTGSIAAFKVAGWVSALAKDEARVRVIMTQAATRFVTPLTFAALSGEKVVSDMFADDEGPEISHIELGKDADIILIAPATAHTIARMAHGLADDLLSATVLAARARIIVCPAMNGQMYAHPATQANTARLRELNYQVIEPACGMMACKDEGQGRLPEWEQVREILLRHLSAGDLQGQRILITAGPTREPLDPARFISNRSSGKMGYAMARAAYRRGAEVTLISGPTALPCPEGVRRVSIQTAEEMRTAVLAHFSEATIVLKSAAVADFRPETRYADKVKKDQAELSLGLIANPDILQELGRKKTGQLLVGFAAESGHLLQEGKKKLQKKNLDLIAVNNINQENTGFEVDTNQITLIDRQNVIELPLASKERTADLILDHVITLL